MKVMNKKGLALVALLSIPLTMLAGTSEEKTAVVTCGEGSVCEAVVNAIGDPIEIDVSKYEVTDLGTITADKEIDITLPAEAGKQTVYSLTPSTGESKDTKTYFIFDNIKQRPGTRLFGKTLVKIYRRFEGQKPTEWIEIGKIEVESKALKTTKANVTFKPDGTGSWKDPITNETSVFLLTKKNLG